MDIMHIPFYNLIDQNQKKRGIIMSELNYINDLLKSLDLFELNSNKFVPAPYPGTDSCFRKDTDRYNNPTTFVRLVCVDKKSHACPHCGVVDHHESKGRRTIRLTHIANTHHRIVLEIEYRRYICKHCSHYFKDDIPFKFYDTMMTYSAAQACILAMRENTALSVIARMFGVSKSCVYRLFNNHLEVKIRSYKLSSVISVDEFRATTDKGVYAFNIVNPITGKVIDIIEDRKASSLRTYFLRFPFAERQKVKIIVMDLSNAFRCTMKSLFPNAVIIADRFHYVKVFNEGLTRCRIDVCAKLDNKKLAKSVKRNLHLFEKYSKKLNCTKEWYDRPLNKYFTSQSYIEYVLEQEGMEKFKECYDIYQMLLSLIHESHTDKKKELNTFIDKIFECENEYYAASAKNIRKNWFMPVLRSLTYKARYIRNNKPYMTSFNNGCIESMNNKVKLVKRNAYGYKYFHNLRKRILLHLNFEYTFK